MIVYALILFAVAVLIFVISALIYKGKTELIHSYHQQKVTDHAAYGKAFGKALSVLGFAMLASGSISLFSREDLLQLIAVGVLILGMAAGIACILAVQKKYNRGLF